MTTPDDLDDGYDNHDPKSARWVEDLIDWADQQRDGI